MDDLLSSGDFSELTAVDDSTVITPQCPICHRQYTQRVKPITMQPCGHGVCSSCSEKLEIHATLDSPAMCPLCRETIEAVKPNWDLREITNNVNTDMKYGFWEKQIRNMHVFRGKTIEFSKEIRNYAKSICIRLAYDDVFVNMKTPSSAWTNVESMAMSAMKNALTDCALQSGDTVDIVVMWIGILSFPSTIEDYIIRFSLKWFESKEFLEQLNGVWLLSAITQPV